MGRRGIPPLTRNLGTRWGPVVTSRPGRFISPGESPDTHCVGSWVGPRACLAGFGKEKTFPPCRYSSTEPPNPYSSHYTDWASSPPPPMALQPMVGQGLIIIEGSLSHPDTPHSVGLLWTSDQSDEQTST